MTYYTTIRIKTQKPINTSKLLDKVKSGVKGSCMGDIAITSKYDSDMPPSEDWDALLMHDFGEPVDIHSILDRLEALEKQKNEEN